MSRKTSRREFLKSSTLVAASVFGAPYIATAANKGEKLKFAIVGAGGRGGAGVGPGMNEDFVAVCDVSLSDKAKGNAAKVKKKFPNAKFYTDYRKMFDAHKNLEAVWVGTPDHSHFPASIRALEMGAGVYCEKPLTHEIWEARKLREVAAKKNVATQMGNQGHSSGSIHMIVDYIRSGALGEIKRVDCVSNRSFGAKSRPATKPVPNGLDWQSWIGPAPYRDYHDGLHSFSWRGYLDFGTGSIGDMACHTIDGAVWGLKLTESDTIEVVAEKGGVNKEGFNGHAKIVYQFPARGSMPPVTLTWWNGGQKDDMPPRPGMLEKDRKQVGQGTYYYGSKNVLTSGSHCQGVRIIPETAHQATPKPKEMVPRLTSHTGDWISALKDSTKPKPGSNFEYSARLTEIVLLGACALRAGQGTKLVYDTKKGEFTNNSAANALLKRQPRKGWEFGYDV